MADSDLDDVIAAARLAPSVHNTQPWHLTVNGEAVEILADRDRQLRFLDPTGRQLAVSCGAAAEFGYLAARSNGRACRIDVLPDDSQPDLLARLVLGEPTPASDLEREIAAAIPRRYTDRGPYEDRKVPAVVIEDVHQHGAVLDVWTRVLTPPERTAVVLVLSDAETAEAADPAYAEELAFWTTARPERAGLPPEATPEWPAERVSDMPLRDFSGHSAHPHPGGAHADEPPSVERDTLLMLGTPNDDPASWVTAGRVLGWALLRFAAVGLSAQPLGQAIDLASGRARLRRELAIVGFPQFLLRVGYGTGRPWTHRRESDPAGS